MTKLAGRAYFAPGRPIRGTVEQQEAAATELQQIYNTKNKGKRDTSQAVAITSNEILVAAEDPMSPLHSMFEWDNTRAAREHRLYQARTMLNALRVETVPMDPPIRLQNIYRIVDGTTSRGYVSMPSALANDRQSVLNEAHHRLMSFTKKFGYMPEFATVVAAIASLDIDEITEEAA